MTSIKRRLFLKQAAASSVVIAAAGAGLLTPTAVLAAWPEKAFEAKSMNDVLNSLLGTTKSSKSGDITIKAPEIAENGAVVPITVSTKKSKVESIVVLVEKNDLPLACSFNLGSNTEGFIKTRVKMGKTSNLTAIIKSGGKLFSKSREVKVTIGGCGG